MLCFLLFSYSSCTDQGCIEADDFGEYEQEILTVQANALGSSCEYDPDKPLTDAGQGDGLKTCFTSDSISIENSATPPVAVTSTTGCNGFSDVVIKNQCIEDCRQKCISAQSSSVSEPDWVSTHQKESGKNIGVTLTTGAKIFIRAIGNVVLGGDKPKSTYAHSSESSLHSRQSDFTADFIDLLGSSPQNIQISGQWNNGSGKTFGGDINDSSDANKAAAWNSIRRLALFVIPHPQDYSFDTSVSSEKAGVKGTPLFADTSLWSCSYSDAGAPPHLDQMLCSSDAYSGSNGYANTNDQLAQSLYGISSTHQTTNLGNVGGMIRWNGDGIAPFSYDPFSTGTCNPSCPTIPTAENSMRGFIGNLNTSTKDVTNTNAYPVRVSLKNLDGSSSTACNTTLSFTITRGTVTTSHSISNTKSWSTQYFALEPNDKMTFAVNTTSSSANCGSMTAYRFSKINDIKVKKSGFVSFTNLGGQGASGSCVLNARIINPLGSRSDFTIGSTTYEKDFYEYDEFGTASSIDPLAGLSVPSSAGATKSWSAKVFVRKGQIIRFDPASWETNWTAKNSNGIITRRCGIGMAIKIGGMDYSSTAGGVIDDRPAFLCRGIRSDEINNPECVIEINPVNNLPRCKAFSKKCGYDPNTSAALDSNSFCPVESCQSSCTSSSSCPTSCTDVSGVTHVTCGACRTLKNATQSPTIPLADLDQCYDLENYTGKVKNIPLSTGFSDAELNNAAVAKGAKKLVTFDGNYGILDDISYAGKNDTANNNNKIYRSNRPVYSSANGRLLFLVIDNNSFDGSLSTSYANNDPSGTAYNGTNGYKIDLAGRQEFKNGQWLEVKLCKEPAVAVPAPAIPAAPVCSAFSITPLAGQPSIIDIADPTATNPGPVVTSYYQFDGYGNLIRGNPMAVVSGAIDPNSNALSQTAIGKNYYRHGYSGPGVGSAAVVNCNIKGNNRSVPTTSECATGSKDCGIVVSNSTYYNAGTPINVGLICGGNNPIGSGSSNCHAQYYCSAISEAVARLRLSFKIKDSDVGNCNIDSPGTLPTPVACSAPSNCGIINENPFYQRNRTTPAPVVTGNDNAMCGVTELIGTADTNGAAPMITVNGAQVQSSYCTKQYFCANKYYNNSGSYQVVVRVENKNTSLSDIVNQVITPVIEIMDGKKDGTTIGQAERVYKEIVGDNRFQAIVELMVILMITFYGVGYLMGVSEFSQEQIVIRIIKIGVVYLFISPTGWEWFEKIFVGAFKDGVDYMTFLMASSFDKSTELQNAIATNNFSDKSILFGGIDKVFGMIFSSAVLNKTSAFLFASVFGPVYLYIIYLGFFLYIYAVANAVLLYLTAQIFISILFVVGPIFFIMLLFNQTKDSFDKWLSELIGLSLQQIFLLITLAFFNMMMYEVIKMALGYRVCWDDVWVINTYLFRIKLLSFWTIASMPPRMSLQNDIANIGNPEGIPSLFSILFIWVIAALMYRFITFMTDLGASIGGSLQASDLGGGIKGMAERADKAIKKMGWGTVDPVIASADRLVFDSGSQADAERKRKMDKLTQNRTNRSILEKAGDAAVAQLKKTQEYGLADNKDEIVAKRRLEAMKEKAKELSINEDVITGKADIFNGGANDLLGLARSTWKQRDLLSKGSLKDRKANSAMSLSDVRSATEDMDEAQRQKFSDDIGSNKVKIESGFIDRTKERFNSGTSDGVVSAVTSFPRGVWNTAGDARKTIGQPVYNRMSGAAKFAHKDPLKAALAVGTLGISHGVYKMGLAASHQATLSDEYKSARDALVDKKAIKKMAFAEWSRPDGEKKLIRERMEQNKPAAVPEQFENLPNDVKMAQWAATEEIRKETAADRNAANKRVADAGGTDMKKMNKIDEGDEGEQW